MSRQRAWHVLLIGGASGVGKTEVSYRLARHYGVGLTEIDDLHAILKRMTTPEQYPLLHFFRNNMDVWRDLSESEKLEVAIGYSELVATCALEPVMVNHLDGGAPVILEGDFLPPAFAVQPSYGGIPANGRVQGLVIYEDDEEQIARNYLAREGFHQPGRARSSWRHSEWLRREAAFYGVPTVAARPWDTALERVIATLETAAA